MAKACIHAGQAKKQAQPSSVPSFAFFFVCVCARARARARAFKAVAGESHGGEGAFKVWIHGPAWP